ncbi:hypothetical protein RHODGE_RHODGE_00440 [Rhodoplanes serenus]|uniref:Uncharacterized protein n=1 Tax=Rhodoplanes serenus TaxID=200615 RepID=A0A447CQ81_9BRAD|nr:DUF6600 domain-containing protein [Rhodoplanes serenus]VCU07337.1 hypothetical protein RHODGE_RHODGE_00440 [Rhodoplanes serenus]
MRSSPSPRAGRACSAGVRLLGSTALAAVLTVAAPLVALPVIGSGMATAQERVEVSAEFRGALDPHGKWHRHQRWGEVWVPAKAGRDWRPYRNGRWVYSDDYGWYWNAADEEAAWGLVVYHYGRWVQDTEIGWAWVPGREWGPAWVDWRRGERAVGWAPLPPDEIVVEVRDRPDYWVFVRPRDLVAERVTSVILPPRERDVFIRETVVVNRTVLVDDRGPRFAVNPGIPPAYIAAAYGRPIRTWSVQPRVLAGFGMVPGAVEVRVDDLRDRRSRVIRDTSYIRESRTTIEPARTVPRPEPLAAGDRGRLGDTPPRAAARDGGRDGARDAAPGATGRQPADTRPGETRPGDAAPGTATAPAERRPGERGPTAGERAPGDRPDQRRDDAAERRDQRQQERPDDAAARRDQPQQERRDGAAERRDQRQQERRDGAAERRDQRQQDRRDGAAERRDQRQQERRDDAAERREQRQPERSDRQGAERSGGERGGAERGGPTADRAPGVRVPGSERGGPERGPSERGSPERGASERGGREPAGASAGRGGSDGSSAGRGGAPGGGAAERGGGRGGATTGASPGGAGGAGGPGGGPGGAGGGGAGGGGAGGPGGRN